MFVRRNLRVLNWVSAVCLLGMMLLINCSYDKIIPDPDQLVCSESFIYNDQIREIISRNCSYSGCHDGSSGNPGNFTTYNGLLSRVSNGQFQDRVLDTRDMPPSNATGPTQLTKSEIDDLTCWMRQGYPEE